MTGQGLALVAVTQGGARRLAVLKAAWPEAEFFVLDRWQASAPEAIPFEDLKSLLWTLFSRCRAMVLVLALGAVIRLLAPMLAGKEKDPAVLVMDEAGRYVIPVLSAHAGAGNHLAYEVARITGATPVITTASEALGLPALDRLAQRWGWRVEDSTLLKNFMALLVNGERIAVMQESGSTAWWAEIGVGAGLEPTAGHVGERTYAGTLVISHRQSAGQGMSGPRLIARPPVLAVGVGAVRGITAEEVGEAVEQAFSAHDLSLLSIARVASIDLKSREAGLLAWAASGPWPTMFYPAEVLNRVAVPAPSNAVYRATGAWAVSRPAALLASQGGFLVVDKWKTSRVTVSVALIEDDSPIPAKTKEALRD